MNICKLKMNSPDTILIYRNVPTFSAGAGRGEAAGTCVPSRGFRVVRESSNIGVAASKLPLKPKLEQVKSRTVGF